MRVSDYIMGHRHLRSCVLQVYIHQKYDQFLVQATPGILYFRVALCNIFSVSGAVLGGAAREGDEVALRRESFMKRGR